MTLAEARKILDGWGNRKPGDYVLVREADRLLQRAWDRHKAKLRKRVGWPVS
jgi:hypothetical protein